MKLVELLSKPRRTGEWMDKRNPLLQCCSGILGGRGAQEGDLLDHTWRG
jgi:hypothetical protein